MKKEKQKIDLFKACWVDQIQEAIWEAKNVFNKVLKGTHDEDEVRERRRELIRADKIIDQVWDALKEMTKEKDACLNEFNRWKRDKSIQALYLMEKKLEKEYLPMFEVLVKGKKIVDKFPRPSA